MKRVFALLILVGSILGATARDYQPSEGWPYMFYDFKPAIVYYNNDVAESANINLHIGSNELHFTDGEKIMIVHDMQRIDSVVFEDKDILLRKGKLYVLKVGNTPRIILGRTQECDFTALSDSNGAYGTSTITASTNNVSSFADHGNVSAWRYYDMISARHDTRSLPTIDRLIFIIDDRAICQATKRGVNELLNKEQKKEFNKFLKENKIKWKNEEHLLLVAQYLESIIDNIAL